MNDRILSPNVPSIYFRFAFYQNNYERVRINNGLHDDAITKPLAEFYPKMMVRKEFSSERELNMNVLKKKEFSVCFLL